MFFISEMAGLGISCFWKKGCSSNADVRGIFPSSTAMIKGLLFFIL